jgi:dTDP-4-dehydrorhamnose 3,5-epimerase-like enzyme
LDKSDVSGRVQDKLGLQRYGASDLIAGVRFIEFSFHSDDGGDFYEITRLDKGLVMDVEGFEVRQINRSRLNPGLVKAFHLHFRQDEVWYVHTLDRLLIGLYDVRKGSSTEGKSMRFVLGGGKSRALYIPKGVAHGASVLGNNPVDVVYLVNQHFSVEQPDEWRLPWDILGDDFWETKKE